MTVSSESNKKIYVGDDSSVNFTFDFLIFANTELEVILTDEDGVETVQTITTHYTVNAGPWPTGGTVTMLTAPATGSPSDELLTIRRKFSYTQLLDYVLSGKFPSATHEQGLDRAVVLIQQMKEIVDRAVLAQTSEDLTSISLEMPNLANRISKFWAWDSLGNLTTAAGTSANLGPVSAYIDTLLPAVDAAAARAILIAAALESNNLFEAGNTFEYGPNYAAASGTDTYTATLTPTLTVLRTGAIYPIYFANASTVVAPTFNPDSLGAKTLKAADGSALSIGQVDGNHLVQYDGTDMRVLNPLAVNPAFSVHLNGTDQSNITGIDKVEWTTEEFDTNGNFDVTTNYRFTPTVAGKYLLSATIFFLSVTDDDNLGIYLYKNGAAVKRKYKEANTVLSASDAGDQLTVTVTVDANGSTDYFEVFAENGARDTSDVDGASDLTYFTGSRIS